MHALGDDTRLLIVRTLADGSEHVCGSLDLGISKATRSHHLKVLREAGITRTRLDGTRVTSRCAARSSTSDSRACSTLSCAPPEPSARRASR